MNLFNKLSNIFTGNKTEPIKISHEYQDVFPPDDINVVLRLIELIEKPKGLGQVGIKKWLGASEITTITKLKKYLAAEPPTNRKSSLVKQYGERAGNLLFKLEESLLLKNGFSNQEFWYICNLPEVNWLTARKLSSFNPANLSDDDLATIPENLSDTVKENSIKWKAVNDSISNMVRT